MEVWNQDKGTWNYSFSSLTEMGFYISNPDAHYIWVSDKMLSFLLKGIDTWRTDDFDNLSIEKPTGIETRVICPICKKELMILVKKKTKHCREILEVFPKIQYYFRCTNEKCLIFMVSGG